jgi:dTDP-4-dehydrorhamnose reductase
LIILILGGTGQIGLELQNSLAPIGQILAPSRDDLNLMNEIEIDKFLKIHRPNLIINAAAWTDVDRAEEFSYEAEILNYKLPKQLAQYANSQRIRVIHYSSDYVYSGEGNNPWKEDSKTAPLNIYGHTKLRGDESIKQYCSNYLIFRTSWVYSVYGSNFMKSILTLAQNKKNLNVISDQIGSPTPARLIAEVTLIAIIKNLNSGVYHLAARGEVSWYKFAYSILELTKDLGIKLSLELNNLHKINTLEYKTLAPRPQNSRLNTFKLESALNISLPDWRNQLSLVLYEYYQNYR